jgi:hypothetical protein
MNLDKQPLLISIDYENNSVLVEFGDFAMIIDCATKQVSNMLHLNASGAYRLSDVIVGFCV